MTFQTESEEPSEGDTPIADALIADDYGAEVVRQGTRDKQPYRV
jgi:hypothetical protein